MASLSVRLALFVLILIAIAISGLAVYLDQQQDAAAEHELLADLRLQADVIAQRLEAQIRAAGEDALLLANTPALQRFRPRDADAANGGFSVTMADISQTFLALSGARRHYCRIRLIGMGDNARELVHVEHDAAGELAIVSGELQRKGHRYNVREALTLPSGQVHYSAIELDREQGRIALPLQPTLRAATRLTDEAGETLGIIVIHVDLRALFAQLQRGLAASDRLYLLDVSGEFLWHPEPERVFAAAQGDPHRAHDEFPTPLAEAVVAASTATRPTNRQLALRVDEGFAALRTLSEGPRPPRLTVVLTRSPAALEAKEAAQRRRTLLSLLLLFAVAVGFSLLVLRRLTASLSTLCAAAEEIASGNFAADLPERGPNEVKALTRAFKRMAREISGRQQELAALTQQLDAKVRERTGAVEAARQRLQEQQALQQTILDNIGDGVVVADRQGRFLLWNHVAEQIVGAGPGEVPPERWAEHYGLYRSEALERVPVDDLPLARAMRGESPSEVELYIRNAAVPQGRWVSVTGRPLRDQAGEIGGGVAILIDITEKKQLTKRLETQRHELDTVGRLALITELADNVAHEMSQPLAAIANYAGAAIQLTRTGQLDPDRLKALLGNIVRLAERGGETLRHLKEVTQFRRIIREPLPVAELLERCLGLMQADLSQRGIHLSATLPPRHVVVLGNAIELEQALLQVVQNAVEALERGGQVDKRIRLSTISDRPPDIRILIEDNGPGVGAEMADRLFDPWETTKIGGIGAGLTIARAIIQAHGGRIDWRREGRLTVFEILLPSAGSRQHDA